MNRKCLYILTLLLLSGLFAASPAVSCSTFMLCRDDCLIVGHNLDQEFYTPGMIHVNRKSENKRSVSCFDLQLTDTKTPILEWTSKYGSVTFSLLGRNLPDGGMNEAGLTVSEMGLGESVFSHNDSRPAMLSHLWIQFQLDSYGTVDEVLEHLSDITIESSSTFTPPASANYHLFITDSSGSMAIVEFLDGGPQVYKNEAAPVPALCNLPYQQELNKLEKYQGFIGWIRQHLHSKEDLRFVKCAAALEDFEANGDSEPVAYCFDVLTQMQFDYTKQWSVAYDVRNRRVYFRTARGPNIRHFDFDSLDFSPDASAAVLPDIDVNLSGDVFGQFVEFTSDADRSVIDRFLRSLVQFVSRKDNREEMDNYALEHYGFDVTRYVERALEATELIRNQKK